MPRLRLLCCSLATTEVGEYEAGIYDCHFCDGECGGCFTAHLCDVVALLRGGRAKGGDRRGRSGPFTLLQDGDRERVASAPSSRAYPPPPRFSLQPLCLWAIGAKAAGDGKGASFDGRRGGRAEAPLAPAVHHRRLTE